MENFQLAVQPTLTVQDISAIFSYASASSKSLAISEFIMNEMQRKLSFTADSNFLLLSSKDTVNAIFYTYNMNPNYLYLPLQAEIYFKNIADNKKFMTNEESKNEYVKACAESAFMMMKDAAYLSISNEKLGQLPPTLPEVTKPVLKIVAGATESNTTIGLQSIDSRFPTEFFSYLSLLNWAAVEFTSLESF